MKKILSILSVCALAACGGGGGGGDNGGNAGGIPGGGNTPVIPSGDAHYIARTSALNGLTAAHQSGDAKALYDTALNDYYTFAKTNLEGKRANYTYPDSIATQLLVKTSDVSANVKNDYDAAARTYKTELASRQIAEENNTMGWAGTYTGTVVARNFNMISGASYNWVDKGTATLDITSFVGTNLIADLDIVLENKGTYHFAPSGNMYYTSVDGNEVKSILGVVQKPGSPDDFAGSQTTFDYHVSK